MASKFVVFERYRGKLLKHLRSEHQRRLRPGPFDELECWNELARCTKLYLWDEISAGSTVPSADRFRQLRRLGRLLQQARALSDQTTQKDIRCDLFRAFVKNKRSLECALSSTVENSVTSRVMEELNAAIRALAILEDAAYTAAADCAVAPKTGRPPILPADCIQGLARIFRASTGSRPGRGHGPFARFVFDFATAVGRDFSDDSIIDAIKNADRQHKQLAKPSHFAD
jgi:hypothetical protein